LWAWEREGLKGGLVGMTCLCGCERVETECLVSVVVVVAVVVVVVVAAAIVVVDK
jgi:hypothetical protein